MDQGDALRLFELVEDPDAVERAMLEEIAQARTDPTARLTLESIYCDEDRDAAFTRFRGGLEFRTILSLLRSMKVGQQHKIVEIGGGPGWLAWALGQEGYDVDLVEPNTHRVTGTGYLASRPDAAKIRIWNDLGEWYASEQKYDLVVSRNCVHHFRGLSHIAASIRQRMNRRARWLMLREEYAETAEDTFRRLRDHPYSQRYRLYEFAHPAWHYVGSLERVGWRLEAVVPARYGNGCLESYVQEEGPVPNRVLSSLVDRTIRTLPSLTTGAYKLERVVNMVRPRPLHVFTRPCAMIFRRREVPG